MYRFRQAVALGGNYIRPESRLSRPATPVLPLLECFPRASSGGLMHHLAPESAQPAVISTKPFAPALNSRKSRRCNAGHVAEFERLFPRCDNSDCPRVQVGYQCRQYSVAPVKCAGLDVQVQLEHVEREVYVKLQAMTTISTKLHDRMLKD